MFSLLSLSYCLSLPLSAVLNLFGIHFICSLPIVDINVLCSMVTDQNSFQISALHLVISLRLFSSKDYRSENSSLIDAFTVMAFPFLFLLPHHDYQLLKDRLTLPHFPQVIWSLLLSLFFGFHLTPCPMDCFPGPTPNFKNPKLSFTHKSSHHFTLTDDHIVTLFKRSLLGWEG
jgi:hypothetical protein